MSECDNRSQIPAKLLACAKTEFFAHGYASANVGNIATACGMSKKTIYKYVASKEELFFVVVAEALSHPRASLDKISPHQEHVVRLEAYLEAFSTLALSIDGVTSYRLIMSEGIRFPTLARTYVNTVRDLGIRPLVDELVLYCESRQIKLENPMNAAEMLISMVIAEPLRDATLGLIPLPDKSEIRQRVVESMKIFLHGI